MKFGIGQPMRRHEDLRLITGRGCYTDDVILPRMTHAFVLRSPVAHAHVKRIDVAAARRMLVKMFTNVFRTSACCVSRWRLAVMACLRLSLSASATAVSSALMRPASSGR
jgi:Aldehyde oxidase and xanthine dehydrogenase, a/b hammerhead domain